MLKKKTFQHTKDQVKSFLEGVKKLEPIWKFLLLFLLTLLLIIIYTIFSDNEGIRNCRSSWQLTECPYLGQRAWEWLELLIVPGLFATGSLLADQYFKFRDKDRELQQVFGDYLDQVTTLFLNDAWPKTNNIKNDDQRIDDMEEEEEEEIIVAIAKARTHTALRELDTKRQATIIQFLINAKTLEFITLHKLKLNNIDLSYCVLENVDLSQAKLIKATMKNAKLRNAKLEFIDFRWANLSNADLSNTDLSNADLRNTNLSNANLSNADLSNADLSNAVLTRANLSNANFSNAILMATDFRKSKDLKQEQFRGTEKPYMCNVALPKGITKIDATQRDAELPELLKERHDMPLDKAKQNVQKAKKKVWN